MASMFKFALLGMVVTGSAFAASEQAGFTQFLAPMCGSAKATAMPAAATDMHVKSAAGFASCCPMDKSSQSGPIVEGESVAAGTVAYAKPASAPLSAEGVCEPAMCAPGEDCGVKDGSDFALELASLDTGMGLVSASSVDEAIESGLAVTLR
jgi:hypothetical protein